LVEGVGLEAFLNNFQYKDEKISQFLLNFLKMVVKKKDVVPSTVQHPLEMLYFISPI